MLAELVTSSAVILAYAGSSPEISSFFFFVFCTDKISCIIILTRLSGRIFNPMRYTGVKVWKYISKICSLVLRRGFLIRYDILVIIRCNVIGLDRYHAGCVGCINLWLFMFQNSISESFEYIRLTEVSLFWKYGHLINLSGCIVFPLVVAKFSRFEKFKDLKIWHRYFRFDHRVF